MSQLTAAFANISEFKLWLNTKSGVPLNLSDIPELIALRWPYFRDNWDFLLNSLELKIPQYSAPEMLRAQLIAITDFITTQRNNPNTNYNPFAPATILTNFYAVWDNIPISSLPISKQEQDIVDAKISKISNFIVTDFRRIRASVVAARDEIADTVKLSDAIYNQIYVRSSVGALNNVRLSDITQMQQLQTVITQLDTVLANSAQLNTVSIDPFALARQNANNPDITIQSATSGKLVRMFYGDSLEDLAARHLNDPTRWMEIAITNGLKPPYIDEVGTTIPLISNAQGHQINIAALDSYNKSNKDKLYINQVVFLQSNIMRTPDQRTITNIRTVPISGELVIELNGNTTLEQYTRADNAHIRVYTPNTINSNFMVMMPSNAPLPNKSSKIEVPFFLATKGEDEKRAGVDLLLNDKKDIIFTPYGDLQLSFGVANSLQAVQLMMESELGQSPKHPQYGIPPVVGSQGNRPEQLKRLLIDSITKMVLNDSRFDRVNSINATTYPNYITLSLVVKMAGTETSLPISFNINTK